MAHKTARMMNVAAVAKTMPIVRPVESSFLAERVIFDGGRE
jgi:hypothetical protein